MIIENNGAVYLRVFGGAGEVGMNLASYEYNGSQLIVDMGIGFDPTLPSQTKTVVPNITWLKKKNIAGIAITHGHDDHIAAIAWLWYQLKVPIYATAFTAELITRKTDDRHLKSAIKVVSQHEWINIDPFQVQFINITHSIPESSFLAISAGDINIGHTGDWKFDPDPVVGKVTNIAKLKQFSQDGIDALVCDSTNIMEIEKRDNSEATLRNDLKTLISGLKGRVLLGCFSSNLARIKTCYDIAKECGRELCLVGRSMAKIREAATHTNYWNEEDRILNEEVGAKAHPGTVLYVCTGSQGEVGSALEKISKNEHHYLKIGAGDAVILSARTITGNELLVDKMINNFARLGIKVITQNNTNFKIHVSGHPIPDDVREMYKIMNPRYVIPVHGTYSHLFAHKEFAEENGFKSQLIFNGQSLKISKGDIERAEKVPYGRHLLEGRIFLDTEGLAIKARYKAQNGIVFVSIGKESVKVKTVGLYDNMRYEQNLEFAVYKYCMRENRATIYAKIIYETNDFITQWFKEKENRKPLVVITVMF